MQVDLSGKRALVTGSTRGIGHAIARRLAKDGACTIINGRTEAAVLSSIEEMQRLVPGGIFEAASGDLSDGDAASDVFDKAGDIDILVNNIGIFGYKPPFEVSDEEWMEVLRVNVVTTARTIRHYGPACEKMVRAAS
jgi:NAD(P)-dependent dehydrogenase (short-subunit alcohol dehydrogenase family)